MTKAVYSVTVFSLLPLGHLLPSPLCLCGGGLVYAEEERHGTVEAVELTTAFHLENSVVWLPPLPLAFDAL